MCVCGGGGALGRWGMFRKGASHCLLGFKVPLYLSSHRNGGRRGLRSVPHKPPIQVPGAASPVSFPAAAVGGVFTAGLEDGSETGQR